MSVITEQDRNNIYEDYRTAIQQIINDPSTPAELKATVVKYGNTGQAPTPSRNQPQAATLNPNSGLGFVTKQTKPQSAPAAAGALAPAAPAPTEVAPAGAGVVGGEPVAYSPAVELPSGATQVPATATTPAAAPNLRGRPATGGTKRDIGPHVRGGRAPVAAAAPAPAGGEGLGGFLQPYMDRLYGRSATSAAAEAGGAQLRQNIPQPTTLNPNSGLGFVTKQTKPQSAPTPISTPTPAPAPAVATATPPAPGVAATTNRRVIPTNPQMFQQQTSTTYNKGSVADKAVMAAGNALNTQFAGLDPNKAFQADYDDDIRKAFGLGSGGTNVAKAMNVFSAFLTDLNTREPAQAQKIANMKINGTAVAKMVKDWANANNYNINQPINASYKYKGDSQLLWEAYQDIVRN
jgi:hypothetical protein